MPDDYSATVEAGFRQIGLPLSPAVHQKLTRYCEELQHWNEKINLTALSGKTLVRRLILEPVWIANDLQIAGSLLDVGSGNGSPAIPIHICRELPSTELVEARTRKAVFLRHLSVVLDLNARVHRGLFKEVLGELRTPDWITLQAVTPTTELMESIRNIAKQTTTVVWITSENIAAEVFPGSERRVVPFGTTTAVLFRA